TERHRFEARPAGRDTSTPPAHRITKTRKIPCPARPPRPRHARPSHLLRPRGSGPGFRRSRHGPPAHRAQAALVSRPRYSKKDRRKEDGLPVRELAARRILRRRRAPRIESANKGRITRSRDGVTFSAGP